MFMSDPLVTANVRFAATSASQTSDLKALRSRSAAMTSKATILPDGDRATVPIRGIESICSRLRGFFSAWPRTEQGISAAAMTAANRTFRFLIWTSAAGRSRRPISF